MRRWAPGPRSPIFTHCLVPLSKFYWQDDWIPFIISPTVRLPREMSELVAVSPPSWLIAELFGSDSRAEKRGRNHRAREWKYHYTIGWWQFFTPEENKGVKMFWITERALSLEGVVLTAHVLDQARDTERISGVAEAQYCHQTDGSHLKNPQDRWNRQ